MVHSHQPFSWYFHTVNCWSHLNGPQTERMLSQGPELVYTLCAKTIRATAKKSAVKEKYLHSKRKVWPAHTGTCSFDFRGVKSSCLPAGGTGTPLSFPWENPGCCTPLVLHSSTSSLSSRLLAGDPSLQKTLFSTTKWVPGHQHMNVARKQIFQRSWLSSVVASQLMSL